MVRARSVICVLALLASIDAAGSAVPAQSVRDSAGIQIVDNRAPALPPASAWRVDPKPLLTIGDPDGPAATDSMYELSLVMGVARLSDGRLAVGTQASNSIRFYDAAGRYVGSASRYGRGPGEIEQLLRMFRVAGDTLLVSDIGDAEYFSGDGKWIRLGASRTKEAGQPIFPQAAFDDQSFAGFDFNDRAERPRVGGAGTLPLVHVSRDGLMRRTLGVFPASTPVGPSQGFQPEPAFASRPHLSTDGTRLQYAYGPRYEIVTIERDGRVTRLVRREHIPAAVTTGMKSEYVAYRRQIAQAVNGGQPLSGATAARFEQALERQQYAEFLPAVGAMLTDRTGNLWVRAYDRRETITIARAGRGESLPSTPTPQLASSWDVFDSRGRWLCAVAMPARFTALDIGADYVAGLARNDDDVEMVQVFRLVKPQVGGGWAPGSALTARR